MNAMPFSLKAWGALFDSPGATAKHVELAVTMTYALISKDSREINALWK